VYTHTHTSCTYRCGDKAPTVRSKAAAALSHLLVLAGGSSSSSDDDDNTASSSTATVSANGCPAGLKRAAVASAGWADGTNTTDSGASKVHTLCPVSAVCQNFPEFIPFMLLASHNYHKSYMLRQRTVQGIECACYDMQPALI
jgi:hypothetical protein